MTKNYSKFRQNEKIWMVKIEQKSFSHNLQVHRERSISNVMEKGKVLLQKRNYTKDAYG